MIGEGEVLVVGLLCAACALPALLYLKRKQDRELEAEVQRMKERKAEALPGRPGQPAAVEVPPSQEQQSAKPTSPGTRLRRLAGAQAEKRPALPAGADCWYDAGGGDLVQATIAQVHADVDGAFYTVRFTDGTEKQTTRGKLDSREERAEAVAAALLEEEEREARRNKGKGGSGRSRKKVTGRDKKRK
jgi:hypothetical protein